MSTPTLAKCARMGHPMFLYKKCVAIGERLGHPSNQDVKVTNNAVGVPSAPVSFQVTPTSSCAVPVNFRASESGLPDGTLHFIYQFDSSTGSQGALSGCTVGETVFYPGSQNPYVLPLPMAQTSVNPTVLSASGSNGYAPDNNKPPASYKTPYVSAHFQAT